MLILVMDIPVKIAIGTALIFSATLKVFASYLYLFKGQINLRVLVYLVAGGLPALL
jgi:uncharacterized protein